MPLFLGQDKISQVVISVENADGGVNTNDATLTSGAQMLQGVTAYSKGTKYTGTIATVEGPTPDITVSDSGLITSNVSNPKGYQASATTKTATQQLTTQGVKVITPNDSVQTAVSAGVYTTAPTTVSAVPTETKTITANGTYSPSAGKYFSSVEVDIAVDTPTYQSKTVSPSTSEQTVTADAGYDALSDVTVNAIQTETKSITSNGTYNPTSGKYFSSVTVEIPPETFNTQAKTVAPSESEQTVTPDNGYDGLSSVTVGAISSTYIGSGITRKLAETYTPTESEQSISAGQYLDGEQIISAIPSTYVGSGVPTQGAKTVTPSTSIQTAVSSGTYVNGDITVDAIPSNYIDTGDATATDSDIASGVTAYVNGEKVTGTVTTVEQNSVRNRFNFNAISFQSSNNNILLEGEASGDTLFRSGSYSQTYIPGFNFGIAKEEHVLSGKTFTSLYGLKITGTMPSKEAAIITPTTTDQTIDAGQYLAGAQTIQGDANLVPENIASGVSIFGVTGTHEGGNGIDTSDATATAADIIDGATAYVNGAKLTGTLVVQNYYTGATAPDSSLGNNGDLYFKV